MKLKRCFVDARRLEVPRLLRDVWGTFARRTSAMPVPHDAISRVLRPPIHEDSRCHCCARVYATDAAQLGFRICTANSHGCGADAARALCGNLFATAQACALTRLPVPIAPAQAIPMFAVLEHWMLPDVPGCSSRTLFFV